MTTTTAATKATITKTTKKLTGKTAATRSALITIT